MKYSMLFVAASCLALTACQSPEKKEPPKNTTALNEEAARPGAEQDQDRKIADAVRQALAKNKAAQNVIVTAKAGVVQLHGQVDSATAKSEIEGVASKISGVTHVDNQLEIKKSSL